MLSIDRAAPGARGHVIRSHGDIAASGPEFWETVESEDERRHRWHLQKQSEATKAVEQRLHKLDNKGLMPGELAIARLGLVAHQKAQIADAKHSAALRVSREYQAEEKRNANERMANWGRYAKHDRDEWLAHHYRRHQHAGDISGLYHNSTTAPQRLSPDYHLTPYGSTSLLDFEHEHQANLVVASEVDGARVFANSSRAPKYYRPQCAFHGHTRWQYPD